VLRKIHIAAVDPISDKKTEKQGKELYVETLEEKESN